MARTNQQDGFENNEGCWHAAWNNKQTKGNGYGIQQASKIALASNYEGRYLSAAQGDPSFGEAQQRCRV